MARKPIAMRHINNILRLKPQNHLSLREIARSCGLPASTVGDYLQGAQAAGLGWPLPESLADPELMNRLRLGTDGLAASPPGKVLPDWAAIHRELRRPQRHTPTALAGISAGASGGLSAQPVLPVVSRVGQDARTGIASGA